MSDNNYKYKRSSLSYFVNRSVNNQVAIFAIVGGVLGYLFGRKHILLFLADTPHINMFVNGFGLEGLRNLHYANILAGMLLTIWFFYSVKNLVRHSALTEKELFRTRMKQGYIYSLPPFPKTEKDLCLVIGENHGQLEAGYTPYPTWSIIPDGGLWGNVAIFGGIGTGKTAATAKPFVRQLFEYCCSDPEKKVGGLVLDVKGNFVNTIRSIAKDYNREKDLVLINPNGPYYWNPVHDPNVEPEVLASRLIAVQENLSGAAGADGQWVIDGALKLITNVLGLHRSVYGYVTIDDLNKLIVTVSGANETDEDIDSPAQLKLAEYKDFFEQHDPTPEEREIFEHYFNFFEFEWMKENAKNTATIAGSVKNITGLFSKPSIRKYFCPTPDQLQSEFALAGFAELIDKGKIVVLDAPDVVWGNVANALGIMLKLDFQRNALSRVSRAAKDPTTNTERPLMFVCDEYQNFVTCSGKMTKEGDDNFYALSRESRCVSLVMTQSPVSLRSKLKEETLRIVLNSIRTKIALTIVDPEDRKFIAEHFGQDFIDTESVSYSENVDGASWDSTTDQMTGRNTNISRTKNVQKQYTYVVQPKEIGGLKAFECFADVFDGVRQLPPQRIYLKPDFVPVPFQKKYTKRNLPYKLFIDWFQFIQTHRGN